MTKRNILRFCCAFVFVTCTVSPALEDRLETVGTGTAAVSTDLESLKSVLSQATGNFSYVGTLISQSRNSARNADRDRVTSSRAGLLGFVPSSSSTYRPSAISNATDDCVVSNKGDRDGLFEFVYDDCDGIAGGITTYTESKDEYLLLTLEYNKFSVGSPDAVDYHWIDGTQKWTLTELIDGTVRLDGSNEYESANYTRPVPVPFTDTLSFLFDDVVVVDGTSTMTLDGDIVLLRFVSLEFDPMCGYGPSAGEIEMVLGGSSISLDVQKCGQVVQNIVATDGSTTSIGVPTDSLFDIFDEIVIDFELLEGSIVDSVDTSDPCVGPARDPDILKYSGVWCEARPYGSIGYLNCTEVCGGTDSDVQVFYKGVATIDSGYEILTEANSGVDLPYVTHDYQVKCIDPDPDYSLEIISEPSNIFAGFDRVAVDVSFPPAIDLFAGFRPLSSESYEFWRIYGSMNEYFGVFWVDSQEQLSPLNYFRRSTYDFSSTPSCTDADWDAVDEAFLYYDICTDVPSAKECSETYPGSALFCAKHPGDVACSVDGKAICDEPSNPYYNDGVNCNVQ